MYSMKSETIECVNRDLPKSKMDEIADAIRSGELVVYPTETLYGLGANALDEGAVKKVYMVKKRPFDMPLSVAVSDLQMLEEIAVIDDNARKLVSTFMPGPLTILVTKRPIVPDILTSASVEVGIRIPDHPFALNLIERCGPITSTSANVHSRPDPRSTEEVRNDFGGAVRFYLDCGRPMLGQPSTIVQLVDGGVELIRRGAIPIEKIEAALNE
ncbi:MAG: L-threonylcarbamoyladenylate synthase [Methanomassiliicoccales archaeon]